jgi:HK97 family phage portal protein
MKWRKWLKRFAGASDSPTSPTSVSGGGGLRELLYSRGNPMLLSTVYRCVDLISDSVATLPLETYRIDEGGFKEQYKTHPAYQLLGLEPNENMTKYVFFKTLITSVLLNGNGYAYIQRDGRGEVEELIFLPPGCVTQMDVPDEAGVYHRWYYVSAYRGYKFGLQGDGFVEARDMIHVLNLSYDGLVGRSTISHAAETLGIARSNEENAKAYFEGGGNLAGILMVENGTPLDKEKRDQIYKSWYERVNGHPNGIAVLEANMKYQALSISPKDVQLLESRQWNVIDICRFFSVSPIKVFDLSKSSYNTIEALQLSYLSETVQPYLVKVEEELNRKLFLRSDWGKVRAEFDTGDLLRTDKSTQSQYLNTMFQIGAITPNEIRRTNNLARVEGGDQAFVQVNLQPLDMAASGGEVKKEEIDVVRE